MKNNKMVLPVIIILLIIFLPLTVIGSYKSLSKGTSLENPSKEHKYKTPVIFPINAILAEKLKKNDDVKVVLLRVKDDGKKYSERNEYKKRIY